VACSNTSKIGISLHTNQEQCCTHKNTYTTIKTIASIFPGESRIDRFQFDVRTQEVKIDRGKGNKENIFGVVNGHVVFVHKSSNTRQESVE
jgi:hypothetical protein